METVVDWLFNTARDTVGYVQLKGGAIRAEFKEEQITKMKEERDKWYKEARQAQEQAAPREEIDELWDRYSTAKRILKAMQMRWRKRVYNATSDVFCSNAAGDAKRIANKYFRSTRAANGLQADRMPEYETHFKTTFGATPTGTTQSTATRSEKRTRRKTRF